jgi:hypothetical protein
VSYKKHLWCFHGVRVAHVFRFLCCPIISLRSEFRVVMFVTISAYKLRSVRRYFQLFVGGLKSCLCYLCLFGSSLPPVVCRRVMSCLCYLCLFGSSLPPVVCRRAQVLFMLFVFVWFVFTSSCL